MYHESLWRVSAQAFNIAVPAGLPALAAAAAAGEDTAASWEALADAFETFLLGANVVVAAQPGSHAYESSMASDVTLMRPGSASSSADSTTHPASQGQEATSGRLAEGGGNAGTAAGAGGQATPAVALAGAAAPTPLSPQQARQDAELEVAVLDCLTDAVLTQCAAAPTEMKQRLIGTVDAGASRPKELSVPQVGDGEGPWAVRSGHLLLACVCCLWAAGNQALDRMMILCMCPSLQCWSQWVAPVSVQLQCPTLLCPGLPIILVAPKLLFLLGICFCRRPPAATLHMCASARCMCCAPAVVAAVELPLT